MINKLTITFSLISIGISCYVLISNAIFNAITRKRLAQNQREWNEYSKHMSLSEKYEVFPTWLRENKIKHGWKFLYIPQIEEAENES